MTAPTVEEQAAEQFAMRMLGVINDAALALMASVGHRTGLFQAMTGLAPGTSTEIAEAAGPLERYVREWLGAMVTGGVVRYDAATGRYVLPPEHAAFLTPAAGPDNLAAFAQELAYFARVEDAVVDRFRSGGGLGYDAYGGYLAVMGELTGAMYDASVVHSTLPLVPGLVERLERGIDVLDVGCGYGHAANLVGQAFPNSTVTGYDIDADGIAAARAEAEALGLTNVRFAVKDAAGLDEPAAFDLVTSFFAIHDLAQPTRTLAAIARALRPGGSFLMLEAAMSSELAGNLEHPLGPYLYTLSCLHCTPVSLADGGEGLGATWGEQLARRKLAEAGFRDVEVRQVPGDILGNYFIATVG
jgi:SAM-dependent methyltransferase